MLNHQQRQKLALAATQIACEGSAFLRNLILARLLGADEMGLAIALGLAIRLFEMAGEFGLDRLLVQVERETLPAMRNMVHLIQLVKSGVLASAAIALAMPVAQVLNPSLNSSLLAVAALGIAIKGASSLEFRERQRQGDFVPALIVEAGSATAALAASLPLAWVLRDSSALVWVLLIQAGVYCLISHTVATTPYQPAFDRSLLPRCLRFGVPVAVNGALMFLALQGDRLVVALNFSAAELAGFALAAQLTVLPALIGARYLLASELPQFARLLRETGRADRHVVTLLRRVTLICLAGITVLGLTGNTLVAWLYGDSFTLSPAVFWLLAIAAGLRLLRGVPGTLLIALERTHLLLLSNMPRLVTLPIAFWLAIHDGSLVTLVAVGVIGEALGLSVALTAAAVPGMSSAQGTASLAGGV